jgi:guanine deaminase
LKDVVGKFEIGYEFDALLVSCPCNDDDGPWDLYPEDGPEILFEKWINQGDERNIKRVWVQGKDVTVN